MIGLLSREDRKIVDDIAERILDVVNSSDATAINCVNGVAAAFLCVLHQSGDSDSSQELLRGLMNVLSETSPTDTKRKH